MRKVLLIKPTKADIVVFDVIGENWIHLCLPSNYTFEQIDLRHHIPLILGPHFFLKLLGHFRRLDRKSPGYYSAAWLYAALDTIDPRIILTFSDRNALLAHYAQLRPDKKVVFMQNALRDTGWQLPPGITLPAYLSLGQIEQDIFRSAKIRADQITPIGSIKLGIAQSTYKPSVNREFDLLFLSHYRTDLFSPSAPELYRRIEHAQRTLFRNLCKYSHKHNLTLGIASKSRDKKTLEEERTYFRKLAGQVQFFLVIGDKENLEFETYYAVLASELIVHPASTLGFEAYAAGKKVLFGANNNSSLLDEWGIYPYFSHLSDLVKINNDTFMEFSKKADYIRSLDDQQYQEQTFISARTIVSMPNKEYPHDVVRKMVSNYLEFDTFNPPKNHT